MENFNLQKARELYAIIGAEKNKKIIERAEKDIKEAIKNGQVEAILEGLDYNESRCLEKHFKNLDFLVQLSRVGERYKLTISGWVNLPGFVT